MKNLSNNKKGFTLIELLSVIVILSVLVLLAVPAATTYLNDTRAKATAINARESIEAVRQDILMNGFNSSTGDVKVYNLDQINNLLQKKLVTSPFSGAYSNDSVKIRVTQNNNGTYVYEMCMIDSTGNGFPTYTLENNIDGSIVKSPATITDTNDCSYVSNVG